MTYPDNNNPVTRIYVLLPNRSSLYSESLYDDKYIYTKWNEIMDIQEGGLNRTSSYGIPIQTDGCLPAGTSVPQLLIATKLPSTAMNGEH